MLRQIYNLLAYRLFSILLIESVEEQKFLVSMEFDLAIWFFMDRIFGIVCGPCVLPIDLYVCLDARTRLS